MARFLSHKEVQDWIEKINIHRHGIFHEFRTDDRISYKFVFSVSKNNIDRFEKLLDRFFSEGFRKDYQEYNFPSPSLIDLNFSNFRKFEVRSEHTFSGVDFVKFNYDFKDVPSLPAIFFIETLKDVIQIIGNYWNFDDDGNEICMIQYPIGSIVSLKSDRSDFIVESMQFMRENTHDFQLIRKNTRYDFSEEMILYKLLKIEKNSNSQALIFNDNEYVVTSDQIIPNRDNRIDQILDK
jgi:hypothetical protein